MVNERLAGIMGARERELIELHRAIVRAETVNPGDGGTAHEDVAAKVLLEWLGARGIGARILAPPHDATRASLVAEIGGEGAGRSLLFMSHLDVVPVGDAKSWKHPPFSGELAEGRVWGRGSIDCKMLVAGQAFALACLQEAGLPERGSVRLIAAADEENGGHWGFGWLAQAHPELLKADLAICEGGGSTLTAGDGEKPMVSVGCGEKGRFNVKFICRAAGGHASTPWGRVNPVAQMGIVLERVRAWRPDPAPASPVFRHLDQGDLEEVVARHEKVSAGLGRSLRAQSRMTFTPTVIEANEGTNVIPSEARLVCDSRVLPGQTRDMVEEVARRMAEGLEGVAFTIKDNAPPSASEIPDELLASFQEAASAGCGTEVRAVPTWCTGATDAHWVRPLGTPVYGFQFIAPLADPKRTSIHCTDESIEAAALLPCALSLGVFAADACRE